MRSGLLVALCCLSLAQTTLAGDPPVKPLRIARVDRLENGQFDPALLASCAIDKVVAASIEGKKPPRGQATELVLRLDAAKWIAKDYGSDNFRWGGTELGVTVLSVAGRDVNRPFLCHKEGLSKMSLAAHCQQVKSCSKRIADQVKTWLAAPRAP